jgi:hypothetical protein
MSLSTKILKFIHLAFNRPDRNRATSPSSLLSDTLKIFSLLVIVACTRNLVGAARSAALVTLHFRSSRRRKMKLRLHSKPVWGFGTCVRPVLFSATPRTSPGQKTHVIEQSRISERPKSSSYTTVITNDRAKHEFVTPRDFQARDWSKH